MKQIAYLSLGSNIGNRLEYITRAVHRLNDNPNINVVKSSSVYETAAWGFENQADFYNIILVIKTDLEPLELLLACQKIEADLDRTRETHWGPRTIDIDIILYEGVKMDADTLTIPHKYTLERAFVTVPLLEIAPDIKVDNVKVADILLEQTCVDTGIQIPI